MISSGTILYGTVPHQDVPERTTFDTVLCRTESARIGTVSITNDVLGGDNVLGSFFECVKPFSSEKGYFGLIICFFWT